MLREPLDTLPPNDVDAERAALACALEKPELFAQLEDRHFYSRQNQIFFRAGTGLEADGRQFNPVELFQRLKDGNAEAQACALAVAELSVPSAANFPVYLATVEDRATRRAQIREAQARIRQAQDTSTPIQSGNNDRLVERIENRSFSPATKPDEPRPRFYLAGIGISTPGNIGTISAQAKTGKTATVGAIVSSTVAQSVRDCLGWQSENTQDRAVVHFDTEQSRFDHWQLVDRAMRRAGVESAPSWLRSYCLTGFSCKDVRRAIRLSLDQSAQKFGGVHSFILDGAADCVADVNDPAESNDFVAELHAMAIQYDCSIIGVIHLNPGSDFKTRGHLGSQLERKAETNLRIEMDSDGITTIWADKNRRAPILKKAGPRFAWSTEFGMHMSMAGSGQADEVGQLAEQLHEAFRLAAKTALHWGELVTALQGVPGITSKRTAERIHSKAKAFGIIETNLLKQWTLA